jgi:hypothetical protein
VLHGRPCFEIEFEGGEQVVCDAGHRWPVCEHGDAGARQRLVATAELVGRERSSAGQWRFSIATCAPVVSARVQKYPGVRVEG